MEKIMSVRLAAKISYLEDRLAGRAGATGRSIAARDDIAADCRSAGYSTSNAGRTDGRGWPWVLPGHLTYTGAEGAEDANLLHFLNLSSCSFGFGSKAWADAR
jgi:hypothetical protein